MHEMTEQSVTVKCWLSNSYTPSGYTFFMVSFYTNDTGRTKKQRFLTLHLCESHRWPKKMKDYL